MMQYDFHEVSVSLTLSETVAVMTEKSCSVRVDEEANRLLALRKASLMKVFLD